MTQGFATLCCIISSFNSIFKNLGTEQFGFFCFLFAFQLLTAGGTLCHMLYLHRNLPVSTTAMMLEHVHIRCWRPDISLIFLENDDRDVLESECCPSRAQRSPVPSLLRTDSASMMLFLSFNHVRLQRWFTKCLFLFCFVPCFLKSVAGIKLKMSLKPITYHFQYLMLSFSIFW